MNGLAALFVRSDNDWLSGSKKMVHAVQRWDHGQTRELYRQLATNIYKTKDGRWYSLHGNMNPTPLLTMLNVPQHNEKNLSWAEILDMYSGIIATLDSETIDNWSNNVYRVPGTICYEVDEFLQTAHVSMIYVLSTVDLTTLSRAKLSKMSHTTTWKSYHTMTNHRYLGVPHPWKIDGLSMESKFSIYPEQSPLPLSAESVRPWEQR
jgi:hypothetical protein